MIAGDGIGQEVVPEGLRVLEEAGRRFVCWLARCDDGSRNRFVKALETAPDISQLAALLKTQEPRRAS